MSKSQGSSAISVVFLTVLFLLLLSLLAMVVAQFYANDEYKPSYFIPKYTGIKLPDQFSTYFTSEKTDSSFSSQSSSSVSTNFNNFLPGITSGRTSSNLNISSSTDSNKQSSSMSSVFVSSSSLSNTISSNSINQSAQPSQNFVYTKTNSLLSQDNGLVSGIVELPDPIVKDELQVCAVKESDRQVFCTSNLKLSDNKLKYVLELEEGSYKIYSSFTKSIGQYSENITSYLTSNNSQAQFQAKKGEEIKLEAITKTSFEKALQESKQTQK
jgi:hypothetical protein